MKNEKFDETAWMREVYVACTYQKVLFLMLRLFFVIFLIFFYFFFFFLFSFSFFFFFFFFFFFLTKLAKSIIGLVTNEKNY